MTDPQEDKLRFNYLSRVTRGGIYMRKNPFSGKNRNQRRRLAKAFANFSQVARRGDGDPIFHF